MNAIDFPAHVQLRIPVTELSQVGSARRAATELGARLRLEPFQSGREALIATELATNLVKHARDGELLLRVLGDDGSEGLEFLAIDRGPGIENLAECLRDGYSSAGSPGTGLGAIRRMADAHDIDSRVALGTVIMARILAARERQRSDLEVGAICLPLPGETACGDAWALTRRAHGCRLIVAD